MHGAAGESKQAKADSRIVDALRSQLYTLRQINNALRLKLSSRNQQIDVIIPAHEKDLEMLERCIASIRKNVHNVRRIIVVSQSQLTSGAEFFPETSFPFQFSQLQSGWHFQQCLKLYAPTVIPGLLDHVVVHDSDIKWMRPVRFISETGHGLYNTSKEPCDITEFGYEDWLKQVLGLSRMDPSECGITHCMLFERHILCQLHLQLSSAHRGLPVWEIFNSSARPSEYELYFQFAFQSFHELVRIRQLKFLCTGDPDASVGRSVDYLVCHSHLRAQRKSRTLQSILSLVSASQF
jgi:hypothetical protein